MFPRKREWKRTIKESIFQYEHSCWCARVAYDVDFDRFRSIHPEPTLATAWSTARSRPDTIPLMKLIASLICKRLLPVPVNCALCFAPYRDELVHLLFDCSSNRRTTKWKHFLESINEHFNTDVYDLVTRASLKEMTILLLGGVCSQPVFPTIETYQDFLIICARFLKSLYHVM